MNSKEQLGSISEFSFMCLSFLFGLQIMRLFPPALIHLKHELITTAPMSRAPLALLPCLAIPAVVWLMRVAGPGRVLVGTGLAISLVRLAIQFSPDGMSRLLLCGIGLACHGWFIFAMATRFRGRDWSKHSGFVIIVATALDVLLYGLWWTRDSAWDSGTVSSSLAICLALLHFAASGLFLRSAPAESEHSHPPSSATLAAPGPYLFLAAAIAQNPGQVAGDTGWSIPAALLLIMTGNCIALATTRFSSVPGGTLTGTALLFAAIALHYFFPAPGLLLMHAGLGLVATTMFAPPLPKGKTETSNPAWRPSLVLMVSMAAFYFLMVLHYGTQARFALPAYVAPGMASLVILATVLVVKGSAPMTRLPTAPPLFTAMLAAALMLPALAFAIAHVREPARSPADQSHVGMPRVMSYNIHGGFAGRGRPELENLVAIMRKSGANIIALQEVSRGVFLNGSMDTLEFLAHRLEMNYVFAGRGRLHLGNAILTSYTIIASGSKPLAFRHSSHRRNLAWIRVKHDRKPLLVINTHLYHAGGPPGEQIRVGQLREILRFQEQQTVLAGDLNAEPRAPSMDLLRQAGLRDTFAAAGGTGPGFTFPARKPAKRIDYIWATPDLSPRNFAIVGGHASDHLGIVVSLRPR